MAAAEKGGKEAFTKLVAALKGASVAFSRATQTVLVLKMRRR